MRSDPGQSPLILTFVLLMIMIRDSKKGAQQVLMQPIKPESDWTSYVTASLLRRWEALRESGDAPLPRLVELAAGLGTTSIAAVALGSVFRLAEACLGRPLNLERCCAPDLGEDACAVIHMLSDAQPEGVPLAFRNAPPGLFSTLASAVASARWFLSEHERQLHEPGLDHITSRAVCTEFAAHKAWR